MSASKKHEVLDLIGVPCPLNWARAKAALEGMEIGSSLELVVDDPRAVRDIPAAAELEGYLVVAIETEPTRSRIVIER